MLKYLTKIILSCSIMVLPTLGTALTFPLPSIDNNVVGQIQYIHTKEGQNISDVAREYDMGFYEMIEANPGINRHSAISPEDTVVIPTEFILPNAPRKGIVINLTELRLYYYPANENVVITGPIAIGRYDWLTPTLETKVIEKIKNPYWHVPKTIKAEAARKGIFWPDVVPPGPKNPLGAYALRLGKREYLIHGTNAPTSIGKRASSGCMRMYPEDIENLFAQVPVDTPVKIVNEFYKLGWNNGVLYMEVHEPLQETAAPENEQIKMITESIEQITQGKPIHIDWSTIYKELKRPSGTPVAISAKVDYTTQSYYEDAPVLSPTTTEEHETYEQEGYAY